MEKLKQRIAHLITQYTINDEVAEVISKEMMESHIAFHQYILNIGAGKTFEGTYVINGIGVFTAEELFNKFIEEKYY